MTKQIRLVAVGLLLVLILTIAGVGGMSPQVEASPPGEFAPGQILVRFHPGTHASAIDAAHRQGRGRTMEVLDRIGVHVVQVPAGDELRAVERYRMNPNVLYSGHGLPAASSGRRTTMHRSSI